VLIDQRCMPPKPRLAASLMLLASAMFLAAPSGFAQQAQQAQQTPPPEEQYVGRFLVYAGYMFLDSPKLNLFEPGFHIQAGMRWSRHVSLGFDYSRGTGNTKIGLNQATTALQNEFDPVLAGFIAGGLVAPNYVAALPFSSVTQTVTAGPEFPYRRFKRFTPYIRPSAGLINETATAHPTDELTRIVVHAVAPSGMESEWTAFYGFGGGCAINVSKHFSLVVQGDFVHDHLFPDLLQTGHNTIRFSIGPGFQFGGDVTRKWGIPGHWE
jgi:opacity protein-like surface antigen